MRLFNGRPCVENPPAVPGNLPQNGCAANTTAIDTVACPGAAVGDFIGVRPAAAMEAGLGIVGAYCAAANVVSVVFMNTTAGALPAGAAGQDYHVQCYPRN